MPKKKSFLMTPDPYHTPGYCGYVPQFKYDVAQTFGSHTHKLLTSDDPKVAASGNSVLCEIFPSPSSLPSATNVDFSTSPVYHNTRRSWGDQKYVPHMVPGYAGFVPRVRQQFGGRYAENCHNAFTSFEVDQRKHKDKMAELHTLTHYQPIESSDREDGGNTTGKSSMTTPLRPLRSKAKPYYPTGSNDQYSMKSPHNMPANHPGKYYMSGFMGFVPKAQRFLGEGYPIITSHALREHASETRRLVECATEPVDVHKVMGTPVGSVELYPRETGLIPRYTGHIPGQKFRFAGTFGSSTRDALRQAIPSAA